MVFDDDDDQLIMVLFFWVLVLLMNLIEAVFCFSTGIVHNNDNFLCVVGT